MSEDVNMVKAGSLHVSFADLIDRLTGEEANKKARRPIEDLLKEMIARGWLEKATLEHDGKKHYSVEAIPFIATVFSLVRGGATFEFLEDYFETPMETIALLATCHTAYAAMVEGDSDGDE